MRSLCLHRCAHVSKWNSFGTLPRPTGHRHGPRLPTPPLSIRVKGALVASGKEIVKEEHALYRDGAATSACFILAKTTTAATPWLGFATATTRRSPPGCHSAITSLSVTTSSFSGDVVVARKHTRFIGRDLDRLIYSAVGKLADLREKQRPLRRL